MKHMRLKLLIISLLVITLGCNETTTNSNVRSTNKIQVDTAGLSLKILDDLHSRSTFKQYDQTLLNYIESKPNKVDSVRKVVYILPFGHMKPMVEEILKKEVAYLKAYLQLDVKLLDRITYDSIKNIAEIKTRLVPSSDYDYYVQMKGEIANLTEQIEANSFINHVVKKNIPEDAIAVLGITEHDMYNPDYNFLFGTSQSTNRVGLVSTFRLVDYGPMTKHNIRKVVSKQIVNMFSIRNVKDYKCVLNFHISIDELIQGSFILSPRALEKLKYATNLDYLKRSEELKALWALEHVPLMTEYYDSCIKRLTTKESSSELISTH